MIWEEYKVDKSDNKQKTTDRRFTLLFIIDL